MLAASMTWFLSTFRPRTSGTSFLRKATERHLAAFMGTLTSITPRTSPSMSTVAWPTIQKLGYEPPRGCSPFITRPASGPCCLCVKQGLGLWGTLLKADISTRPSRQRTTSCTLAETGTSIWKKTRGQRFISSRRPSTCIGAASGSTSSMTVVTSSKSSAHIQWSLWALRPPLLTTTKFISSEDFSARFALCQSYC